MTPFRKVKPGDAFTDTAQPWNRFIDAARAHSSQAIGTPHDTYLLDPSTTRITCGNNTGGDRRPGDVVSLHDTQRLTTDLLDNGNIWLSAITPDATKGYGIVREHFPASSVEKDIVQVAGVCMAHVNITDTAHRTARISGSSHVLVSASNGPVFLLYAPNATGEQQCAVIVNQPMTVFVGEATLEQDMCGGNSATFNSFEGYEFGQYIIAPDPLPTTAQNPYKLAAKATDKVLIIYDQSAAVWKVIQVQHQIVEDFPIDIRWNSSTLCLVKDGVTASVQYCDDPVESNILCGVVCVTPPAP